jgi:hypothetical protein
MKNYIILFILIVIGLTVVVLELLPPVKKVQHKYSPTSFIEPSENFIDCFNHTDCIKVKGSACPPSSGGLEVCVNKDHFQEYISEINEKAGNEEEVACPDIFLVSNKTCDCFEGNCRLV